MENYFISLLFVTSFSAYVIRAWFNSTLSAQIFNIFIKKENRLYTKDDVDSYLINKPFFVYSLLTCPICMAFHLSLWATIFTTIVNSNYNSINLLNTLSTLFISSIISSYFGELKENKNYIENENTNVKHKSLEYKEQTSKDHKLEDFGGYLVEKDKNGNSRVVGTTPIYDQFIKNVFDETRDCNFPRCTYWREQFKAEIDILEKKHKENGKHCPECIKSGVKRKFYDIIKNEIESVKNNESN